MLLVPAFLPFLALVGGAALAAVPGAFIAASLAAPVGFAMVRGVWSAMARPALQGELIGMAVPMKREIREEMSFRGQTLLLTEAEQRLLDSISDEEWAEGSVVAYRIFCAEKAAREERKEALERQSLDEAMALVSESL